jgi:putative spermidine/putrescine transport system permease protein
MANVTQEVSGIRTRQTGSVAPVKRRSFAWVGVVPFFLYVGIFLLLPTIWLVVGAFQTDTGAFTLTHLQQLTQSQYLGAYLTSIKLSLATALTGGISGLFVAYAAVKEGSPPWIRAVLSTFSGVAANFAGVPLAFAFVATLGLTGIVTVFLADHGISLYSTGFTLTSFGGLVLVYTYFQLPLMILLISPALDGLRRQWREAATNLGASTFQFWLWVGLPILWPSLLGAFVLLFGSAFSAYATAVALTGGTINLVPILIGNVVNGNLVSDPQFGDALALGMVVIISISMVIYSLLQQRSSRWLR